MPSLATARLRDVGAHDAVLLEIAGRSVAARRDPSVHPVVLEGALRRGERVVVERDGDGALLVVGVLRTQPTPGIDRADAYSIEADRIALASTEQLSITTRAAGIVLRAMGEVETFAERIVSRAEGVHKIVGRMLRLN